MQTKHLVYKKLGVKESYTNVPQSTLDLERLINGQPCWKQMTPSSSLAKKTLIIIDWTIQFFKVYSARYDNISSILIQLVNQDYSIYFWQNGFFIPLTDASTISQFYRGSFRRLVSQIMPEKIENIIQAAKQQLHLSQDQIQLVDDYQFSILQGKNIEQRTIDLKLITAHKSRHKVIEWLKTTTPRIEFINDLSPEGNSRYPQDLLTCKIPIRTHSIADTYEEQRMTFKDVSNISLRKNYDYRSNTVQNHVTKRYIDICSPKETKYILLKLPIDLIYANEIYFLYLSNIIIDGNLLNIILSLPKLKSLSLINVEFAAECILPTTKSQINRFEIVCNYSDYEIANSIIAATTNLKFLSLIFNILTRETPKVFEDFKVSPPNARTLSALKKVKVFRVQYMSVLNLSFYLQNLPELKYLDLNSVFTPNAIKLEKISLPLLENLFINDADPTSFFNSEKFHAPKLDYLYFSNAKPIIDADWPLFPSIKTIHFAGVKFIDRSFINFLDKTTCENLTFQNIRLSKIISYISDKESWLKLSFNSSVKTLMLYGDSYLGGNKVAFILYKLTKIERLFLLNFSVYHNSDRADMLSFIQPKCKFSELKELNILSSISKPDNPLPLLKNILKNSKKLHTLYLNYAESTLEYSEELNNVLANFGSTLKSEIIYKKQSDTQPAPQKSQQVFIDADTQNKPTENIQIKKVFYKTNPIEIDPDVRLYRKDIFDSLEINSQPTACDQAFLIKRSGRNDYIPLTSIPSKPCDVLSYVSDYSRSIYGKQTFYLGNEWQALASMSPAEELLCYHISEPLCDIEIQYCKYNNLHYIRQSQKDAPSRHVTIDFLLTVPVPTPPTEQLTQYINKYKAFKVKESSEQNVQTYTGEKWLEILEAEEAGACRHRAVLLKSLADKLQINSRIVLNDSHAFIEIMESDKWITCDLGGYPRKLIINEPKIVTDNQLYLQQEFIKFATGFSISSTPEEYFSAFFTDRYSRKLIYIDSNKLIALNLLIQAEAVKQGLRVICINKFKDLMCGGVYFKRTLTNHGIWQLGGGPVFDALKSSDPRPLIILLNLYNFSADEIVSSNYSYGEEPTIGQISLPSSARIVALYDPKTPESYNGNDFISRFSHTEYYPFADLLHPQNLKLTPAVEVPKKTINLYHSLGWQNELLFGCIIKGNAPMFQPGELELILDSTQAIEILNPPEDDDFDFFWQEALLHKKIQYAEKSYTLPSNFSVSFRHAYEWDGIKIEYGEVSNSAHILNSTTLKSFIEQYKFINNQFTKVPGILSQYTEGDTVEFLLTRELNQDEMDRLIQHGKLKRLAFKIQNLCLEPKIRHYGDLDLILNPITAIFTTDADLVVNILAQRNLEALVIDCSDYSYDSLFERVMPVVTGTVPNITLAFNYQKQVVLKALDEGRSVILTGDFSDLLLDNLAVFCHEFQRSGTIPCQLAIVSTKPLSFLPNAKVSLSAEIKKSILPKSLADEYERLASTEENCLNRFSYTELKSRLMYLACNPYIANSQQTYQGFDTVSLIKPSKLMTDISQINEERFLSVNMAFFYMPYVFLAGPTGIGKSYFFENILSQHELYKGNVFFGMHKSTLIAWATHTTPDTHMSFIVLCIDEANLDSRDFSEFEGLFFPKPHIIIDDKSYPLSRNHRVLFAGNPLSYGGSREIPRLFKRHANAIIFSPLLFICPSLVDFPYANTTKTHIRDALSEIYNFFIEIAVDEVLISPRQIKMICLLLQNYSRKNLLAGNDTLKNMVYYYANQVIGPSVPSKHHAKFYNLFVKDRAIDPGITLQPFIGPTGHIYVPSRMEKTQQIINYLDLRARFPEQLSLKRVIISGDSGIGKTQWIKDIFVSKKISFVILRASDTLDARKTCLLKAFDEGLIVFIDEANSLASMEEWLIFLLDGKHPFENYRPPHKLGFGVFCAENDATLKGRNLVSYALQNRTLTINLNSYPTEELVFILKTLQPKLNSTDCNDLVSAFEYHVKKAREEYLPIPTLRQLLRVANLINQDPVAVSSHPGTLFNARSSASAASNISRAHSFG